MYKKLTVILLAVLFVVSFNVNVINASEELASETIKVVAHIPAYQEMEVIDPIYIRNVNDKFDNDLNNEHVIISEAGRVRIKSNAPWKLELNNRTLLSNYELMVRLKGSSEWKDVSNGAVMINGENGNHLLSFDIKLVAKETAGSNPVNESIEFDYTLVQI